MGNCISLKKPLKKAKRQFEIWEPERKEVIKKLKTIKDEIQEQARIHSIGSKVYFGVRVVGKGLATAGIVAAPFSSGASLGLIYAGALTEVTSGVAEITHNTIKTRIVSKQCIDAKESLEKHVATDQKLKNLLIPLKSEINILKGGYNLNISHKTQFEQQMKAVEALLIPFEILDDGAKAAYLYRTTGNAGEAAKLLNLEKVQKYLVPSSVRDVTNLPTEALGVFTVVGVITDLISLISDASDLQSIEKGKLCAEAEKLQHVIVQLEHEYDLLKREFSNFD